MTHFDLEYHVEKDGQISVVVVGERRHSLGVYPTREHAITAMDRWRRRASGWIVFVRDGTRVRISRVLKSPIVHLLNMQKGNASPLVLEQVLDVGRTELRKRENEIARYWYRRLEKKTGWYGITPPELVTFLQHEWLLILRGLPVPAKDTIDTAAIEDATVEGGPPLDDPNFSPNYIEHLTKRAQLQPEDVLSPLSQADLDTLDAVQTSRLLPPKPSK